MKTRLIFFTFAVGLALTLKVDGTSTTQAVTDYSEGQKLQVSSIAPGAPPPQGQTVAAQTQVTDVLEGLDPVLLVQGKETQGELKITATRGQFRYMFATQANKAVFEQDPTRYEIQLDGACARMGAPVRGIADLYAVHKGRIYIFGSEQCKTLFVAAPDKYLPPPKSSLTPSHEAMKQGAALLDKAVAAMGGKIDGMHSYHEKSVTTQTRGMQGEVVVKNDLLAAFPANTRMEVAMPDFNDVSVTMRMTTVLAKDPFVISRSGRVLPLDASQRAEHVHQLLRKPLFLLRARGELNATYIGAGKAGGTAVEQVAIEFAGSPAMLGIDAATGRLLSLSYQRRGPQGNFGEFVQTFSDFRVVEGITLPFKATATFDGQPWKDQSMVIEAITINGVIRPLAKVR